MMAWLENHERAARGETVTFFCECRRRRYRARLQLTGPQYEAVRVDAARFVIAHGHEFPEAGDLVEHEDVRELGERMNRRRTEFDEP